MFSFHEVPVTISDVQNDNWVFCEALGCRLNCLFYPRSPNRYEDAAQVINSFVVGMGSKREVALALCAYCICYL